MARISSADATRLGLVVKHKKRVPKAKSASVNFTDARFPMLQAKTKDVPTVFADLLLANGIHLPEPEYRFHPVRRWRFDYAWPEFRIALEIEGGAWSRGRHTRGKGFLEDMAKYNAATLAGWRVYRCTPQQFESGDVLRLIEEAFRMWGGKVKGVAEPNIEDCLKEALNAQG